MPRKQKLRMLVFQRLASHFEMDKIYSEKQVNEILDAAHTFQDFAWLRRELIEAGILTRNVDGTNYRKHA